MTGRTGLVSADVVLSKVRLMIETCIQKEIVGQLYWYDMVAGDQIPGPVVDDLMASDAPAFGELIVCLQRSPLQCTRLRCVCTLADIVFAIG